MSHILKVENLSKSYPGVRAVDNISFELQRGEVLALLGENGAGKSTLTKMICGVEKPDEGRIFFEGNEVSFDSALDAMKIGISMVHQELSMVGDMSVAENIFINRQPTTKIGTVKWNELYKNTKEFLRKFNLNIPPDVLVKKLSIGTQQLLEILKAISLESKIIILDEPTSSLTDDQIDLLFNLIKTLKKEGYSFIYITHKLNEVFQISDHVIIIRDGRFIKTAPTSELTATQIITMMVGREIKNLYGESSNLRKISEDYYFRVEGLSTKGLYQNISFGVKKGEILGIAGLVGAGRSEMALGIIGSHKRESGRFFKDGAEIFINNPGDAIRNGVAYLTEDRKKLGLYLDCSIKDNLSCMKLEEFSKNGIVQNHRLVEYSTTQVEKYKIAAPSIIQRMMNLSGGNQQKCLLAAWIGINPSVFIIDEPTRGVDVGAKSEIYQTMKDFTDQGKAVVIISSELPELLGICDRILVMYNGEITGEVGKSEFSEETIMHYATGIVRDQAEV